MNTLADKFAAIQMSYSAFTPHKIPNPEMMGYRITDKDGMDFWISTAAYSMIISHANAQRKESSVKPVKELRNVYSEVIRDEINSMTDKKPLLIRVSGGEKCIPDNYMISEIYRGSASECVYQLLNQDNK